MTTPHDSWAEVYDRVYAESFGKFYDDLTAKTLSVINELAARGCDILDVGAGTGRLAIPLSQSGFQVTAVDASRGMLDVLSRKDPSALITTHRSLVQELRLNRKFPFIACVFSVFCYLTTEGDLKKCAKTIASHLSDGGKALIDCTARVSFQGLNYQSEELIRTVIVEEEDPDEGLFRYYETVQVWSPDGALEYKDEFSIKYWDYKFLLGIFAEEGLNIELDLQDRFLGSGAHYFLLAN
ncbi:class I SAM-dependent methyltransferase [Alphaproteobacteria bacterium]|nr:class I SAM-dependent methyltransferase [Alphaproteobacteria bacterium]MDC1156778.1 class I SAM-dependent methyltransferase [Alphaproteobacteria bacterium]